MHGTSMRTNTSTFLRTRTSLTLRRPASSTSKTRVCRTLSARQCVCRTGLLRKRSSFALCYVTWPSANVMATIFLWNLQRTTTQRWPKTLPTMIDGRTVSNFASTMYDTTFRSDQTSKFTAIYAMTMNFDKLLMPRFINVSKTYERSIKHN